MLSCCTFANAIQNKPLFQVLELTIKRLFQELYSKNLKNRWNPSFAGICTTKYSGSGFTWMAEGVYGQNLTDLLMLGGYARKCC